MSKRSAVLLILLLVSSSSLMSSLVCAATAKPPVPEFTLKIVARPYDVPPAVTTDPYNGKTVITQGGYHVENKSIDIITKNPPFTPYTVNGSEVNLYYQVQFKGHFEQNWQFYWVASTRSTDNIPMSDGDYTVISVPIKSYGVHGGSETNFPEDGQVDFRVKALIGYFSEILHPVLSGFNRIEFNSEESNWSNIKTITIDENTPEATPDGSLPSQSLSPLENENLIPNQSSTQITIQLGLDWIPMAVVALLGVIAVLLTFMVVFLYKRNTKKNAKV